MNDHSNADSAAVSDSARLHRAGFVVSSIQDCADGFSASLGAAWDGKIYFDPIQNVRVTFFNSHNVGEASIELVEPRGLESPVARFLEKGSACIISVTK